MQTVDLASRVEARRWVRAVSGAKLARRAMQKGAKNRSDSIQGTTWIDSVMDVMLHRHV